MADNGKLRFTIAGLNEYRKTGTWNAAKYGPPPGKKEYLDKVAVSFFPWSKNTHLSVLPINKSHKRKRSRRGVSACTRRRR